MRRCLLAVLSLAPTASLAQQGSWEVLFDFGDPSHVPINAVHMVHVFDGSTGKVVAFTWDNSGPPGDPVCPPEYTRLWTPPIGTISPPGLFETIPPRRAGDCYHNWTWIVCCGHSALADGRIFTAAGNYSPQADLFDSTPPPALQRWNDPQRRPICFKGAGTRPSPRFPTARSWSPRDGPATPRSSG